MVLFKIFLILEHFRNTLQSFGGKRFSQENEPITKILPCSKLWRSAKIEMKNAGILYVRNFKIWKFLKDLREVTCKGRFHGQLMKKL